jgi:hypothetical protein
MYSIPSLRGILSETGSAPVTGPFPFYTNGTVNTQVVVGNDIYIGGAFTTVGAYKDLQTSRFCVLNSSTAAANFTSISRTLFNGTVYCSLVSGSYIYVGGSFTSYNNQPCLNLVKISLADGSLDANFRSNTGFNTTVFSLALDGSNLYVGGAFTNYKGTTRQYIAKINATTAALDTTFDSASGFNGIVRSIALDGSGNLYAGGDFNSYKGTARQYIAKINPTTAALDTTFSSASGFNTTVRSIALDSSGNLYAGGDFTSYKGTTRIYVAKVNASTAALDTTFDTASSFNNTINVIALDGLGNLYAGGSFASYKGTARQNVAKISATTAALDTTFNSAVGTDNYLQTLTLDGSGSLYIGGFFNTYKGTAVKMIAKINATTAALDTTFDSSNGFNTDVYTISVGGSGNLYVGGGFESYKTLNPTVSRQNIAKISLLTGIIDTTFNTASGITGTRVSSIALDGSGGLYVGGLFTAYKGTTRQNIAKINATTAALDTTFDSASGFGNAVNSIALDGSGNLYAAGSFTTYKGTTRQYIAKLNPATAALDTTFDSASGFGNAVNVIVLDGLGSIYAGGTFPNYKGTARQRIAKINATTAALDTTFNSASGFANTSVLSIVLDGSGNLYACGDFTFYKTITRQYIAKINATTAALDTTFDSVSGFNIIVRSIALDSSGNLYAGGDFTTYKGTARQNIAKINPTTAALDTTFDSTSGFNSTVRSIALDSSGNLYAGGDFTTYGNSPSNSTYKVVFGSTCSFILNTTTALPKGYY